MTEKHDQLIDQALSWLQDDNYTDIEFEVKVPNRTGERLRNGNNSPRKPYYAIDIIGRNGSKKIAVECGGSKATKLDSLLGIFNEVWVFPYGGQEPYQWQEGMTLCQRCGHTI